MILHFLREIWCAVKIHLPRPWQRVYCTYLPSSWNRSPSEVTVSLGHLKHLCLTHMFETETHWALGRGSIQQGGFVSSGTILTVIQQT